MSKIKYLDVNRDSSFFDKLNKQKLRTTYAKVIVREQRPGEVAFSDSPIEEVNNHDYVIQNLQTIDKEIEIQGKVISGSLTIDGKSSFRRVGNITYMANEEENDLTDIDNVLSINKKIKLYLGFKNDFDTEHYEDIVWLNMGIYYISTPSISHATNGVTISFQLKDSMSKLSGDAGGALPAPLDLSESQVIIEYRDEYNEKTSNNEYNYYQEELNKPNEFIAYGKVNGKTPAQSGQDVSQFKNPLWRYDKDNGWYFVESTVVGTAEHSPILIYDMVQTLVNTYGGEPPENIVINDVPRRFKQVCRWMGQDTLYYDPLIEQYTLKKPDAETLKRCYVFNYGQECGYIYTDFVYPKSKDLQTGLGEYVTNVLEKITSAYNNYEYFYDVDGRFIFQEKKNYMNNKYIPKNLTQDNSILDDYNYRVDFRNLSSSLFTFDEESGLVTSFQNSYNYNNIKNDFHIWGKDSLHYHLAIRQKPPISKNWYIEALYTIGRNKEGNIYKEYNGRVVFPRGNVQKRLNYNFPYFNGFNTLCGFSYEEEKENDVLSFSGNTLIAREPEFFAHPSFKNGVTAFLDNTFIIDTSKEFYDYTPSDWRAELYLRGIEKQSKNIRLDVYEEEVLDKFDDIYNMFDSNSIEIIDGLGQIHKAATGSFKSDVINSSTRLKYWIDYIEPTEYLGFSTEAIGVRGKHYQEDKELLMYEEAFPDCIILSENLFANRDFYFTKNNLVYSKNQGDTKDRLTFGGNAAIFNKDISFNEKGLAIRVNITTDMSGNPVPIIKELEDIGERPVVMPNEIYEHISRVDNTYTAQDYMRDLVYQHTSYNETCSLSCLPVYTLEPNHRIYIKDKKSGIDGEHILEQMNIPLDGKGLMNISATKALDRF